MKINNGVAVPTTSLEQKALQNLKYNALEKDSINPLYMPMADENICNGSVRFIDELCHLYNNDGLSSGQIVDWIGRPDGAVEIEVQYDDNHIQTEVLGIPSNLDVLIAFYKGIGRHRKASMLVKKYKKLM